MTSFVSWPRELMPSFCYTWRRWLPTVKREMCRRSPIWRVVSPSAARATTRCSAGVRLPHPVDGRSRGPRVPRLILGEEPRLADPGFALDQDNLADAAEVLADRA